MTMRRTASSPAAWTNGWKADAETLSVGPRWTSSKGAKHAENSEKWHTYLNNTKFSLGGGYRDTWVQAHTRRNLTPGPGHYKTDSEMPCSSTLSGHDWMRTAEGKKEGGNWRDEFNANTTRKERAPKYTTLGRKELREVSLPKKPKLDTLKPSWMNTPVGPRSNDVKQTPGPGHYTQNTSFGAASGGHRHHFFPGPPEPPKKKGVE